MVASVFPFEAAGSWVGAFYRVVGVPMRLAWKESRDHLPLRRDRGRALYVADVRGSASAPPRKVAGFYHGADLARSCGNVSVRGFSVCK
jgi:hypothetical protein